MTDLDLLELARSEGFSAAMTTPDQVPVEAKFRAFCEENLCGKYNANYSCPPDCGTPEELHKKILAEEKVMVLQSICDIDGYEDRETIMKAKKSHNEATIRLIKKMREHGFDGFCAGASGCLLCSPCKKVENQPCAYPDLKMSCMSAYCVNVAELAKRCDLTFVWSTEKLYSFGMIVFHKV